MNNEGFILDNEPTMNQYESEYLTYHKKIYISIHT